MADHHTPAPVAGEPLLGRYQALDELGRGGMGVVLRGRDLQTGRPVAIKRVRSSDERAEREARAAARLRHPAIVQLLDAALTDDGWILISELVDGPDLRAVLRSGRVPDVEIARICASVARGLDHAHSQGVVHRDVKPANILCPRDPRSAGAWAKLTDFGIAAMQDAETLTEVGDVVGTMAYMSPEQARGSRAGEPADVFSLAVVAYEALSGVNPRRGSTPAETAARALGSMPPLARVRPDLPPRVHAALDACLELDPDHRGTLETLDEGLHLLSQGARARRPAGASQNRTVVQPAAQPGGPTPMPPIDPRPPRPGHGEPPWDDGGEAAGDAAHGWRQPEHDYPGEVVAYDTRGSGVDDGYAPDPGAEYAAPGGWAQPPGSPEDWRVRGRAQPLPRLPGRIAAAGGAVTATLVLASGQMQLGAALVAATLGMLLPRLSWLAVGIAAIAVLAGHKGDAALLAAIATLTPIVLLPKQGPLWSASGLSAGLTVLSVPLVGPALAALAPTPYQRAALGVQAALVAAVVATASSTVIDAPAGNLGMLLTKLVLPLAGIWGVAAVALPVLARGRTLGSDLLGGAVWTGLLGGAMVATKLCDASPGLWLAPGAAVAVLLVVRSGLRWHNARQYELVPQ